MRHLRLFVCLSRRHDDKSLESNGNGIDPPFSQPSIDHHRHLNRGHHSVILADLTLCFQHDLHSVFTS